MSLPRYLAELNGYLKSLQLLNGPNSFRFGVRWYQLDGGVEDFFKIHKGKISFRTCEIISFQDLESEVFRFTLNGLISSERFPTPAAFAYFKKMMFEDINEYYGLASSTENSRGVFHPLIRGPVYKLHPENGDGEFSSFCFLVRIESYFVLTHFKMRRKSN